MKNVRGELKNEDQKPFTSRFVVTSSRNPEIPPHISSRRMNPSNFGKNLAWFHGQQWWNRWRTSYLHFSLKRNHQQNTTRKCRPRITVRRRKRQTGQLKPMSGCHHRLREMQQPFFFHFIFKRHFGLPLPYRVTNNNYTNTLPETKTLAFTRLQNICLITFDDIHNVT